jgi:3-keto-disaccharide hydrolase
MHQVRPQRPKDFQIYVEFWASDDANSGIFIRCQEPTKITDRSCYEVNIFDQRKDPTYGTGGIVHFVEVNPMPKAGGKWNTYEITAKGRQITGAQRPEDGGVAQRPLRRGAVHAATR